MPNVIINMLGQIWHEKIRSSFLGNDLTSKTKSHPLNDSPINFLLIGIIRFLLVQKLNYFFLRNKSVKLSNFVCIIWQSCKFETNIYYFLLD
ncbi:hypothetical protein RhiirB3_140133 [Rhizophagus irregularis]|nr:hypothetical protein RhiirB3_140133 [Rhizophagus irregularis]